MSIENMKRLVEDTTQKTVTIGYLDTDDSFSIFPTVGSQTLHRFMDGSRDVQLTYQLAMKSKNQQDLYKTLLLTAKQLSDYVTNTPVIEEQSETGYYIFTLDLEEVEFWQD